MNLKRAVGLEGSIRRASRRRHLSQRPIDAWRRRAVGFSIALALGLVGARALLPTIVKHVALRELRADGWNAHVEDVSLSLWRASWELRGLQVEAPDGGASLACERVQLSLSAPSLPVVRPRSRLTLVKPQVRVGRPVAAADLAARVRRLASDSIVDWRVEDAVVDWPLADGAYARIVRVHGSGRVSDAARGRSRGASLSGMIENGGRLALEVSARGTTGALVQGSGSGLELSPGGRARFVLAFETGEGGHLLAGRERGELEPSPLLIPQGAGPGETAAAALSQALEAAARSAPKTR